MVRVFRLLCVLFLSSWRFAYSIGCYPSGLGDVESLLINIGGKLLMLQRLHERERRKKVRCNFIKDDDDVMMMMWWWCDDDDDDDIRRGIHADSYKK